MISINKIILMCLFGLIFSYEYLGNQNDIFRENLILQENRYRDENELLEFVELILHTHLVPGLSISIVKDDAIVWEKQLGYANIADDILVDESTMFIISSISKTITVTALMQLYESGLFNLDDDINSYLPFNVIHPDYPLVPITFRMLLAHSSGIRDNWSIMTYYDGDSDLELSYYLNQYFSPGGDFYNTNLNFTDSMPGTGYDYSNNGAALVGLLVEEISDQSFNDYCIENIFEPLSMNNAFWFLSEINNLDQVALPYQNTGGSGNSCFEIGCGKNDPGNCACDFYCVNWGDCCSDYDEVCGENGIGGNPENLIERENYGYADYPSGQLRTTSNNLAIFMGAYMNGGSYNGVRILESETIELIKTIQYPTINSKQGLIWKYKNDNGRLLFGHNGGDVGSSTDMFISFEDNIGIVLLTNSNNYNAMIQIERAIFNFAEETDFITGDINLDNVVNIADVVSMVGLILNSEYNDLSDLNSDGLVDVLDILQLVNIIVN